MYERFEFFKFQRNGYFTYLLKGRLLKSVELGGSKTSQYAQIGR